MRRFWATTKIVAVFVGAILAALVLFPILLKRNKPGLGEPVSPRPGGPLERAQEYRAKVIEDVALAEAEARGERAEVERQIAEIQTEPEAKKRCLRLAALLKE